MKLIILEGVDRCGKNLLIQNICKHFNYDNVIIRHFSKPPEGLTTVGVLDFQFKCFNNEANLLHEIRRCEHQKYYYFENIVIWNRSHLGEFVHGQMFRNADPNQLKEKLHYFEKFQLDYPHDKKINVYLITLIADPEFLLKQEDGQSFSQTLEEKAREVELFKEIHAFSIIKNKLIMKVDNDGVFRPKEHIFKEVIDFIK